MFYGMQLGAKNDLEALVSGVGLEPHIMSVVKIYGRLYGAHSLHTPYTNCSSWWVSQAFILKRSITTMG